MKTLNITAYKGDTWNGIPSITLQKNGNPIVIPNDASIYMQIKNDCEDSIAEQTLSTANGCISITDGANGTFRINPTIINIPSGTYVYDIQINFSSTLIKTYMRGSLTVVQDVTEPDTNYVMPT